MKKVKIEILVPDDADLDGVTADVILIKGEDRTRFYPNNDTVAWELDCEIGVE